MSGTVLIENGMVVVTGRRPRVLSGYSVLIENGVISRIEPAPRLRGSAKRRIDASGKVVMAGFINAHTHLYSTFARGLTKTKPGRDFPEVLRNLWWRLDSALTRKDCQYSALVALLEGIRHGVTTVIDHHASPGQVKGSLEAIARAVRDTGVRACLCYEVSDRDGADVAREGLEENAGFVGGLKRCGEEEGKFKVQTSNFKGSTKIQDPSTKIQEAGFNHRDAKSAEEGQRINRGRERERGRGRGGLLNRPAKAGTPNERAGTPSKLAGLFGLHASFTLNKRTLERAVGLGRELGVGFHIHVAESECDQRDASRRFGKGVVERLHGAGVLGPRSIAAHCVHVSWRDMDLLAESGTAVVHNPQSNMNNAVGMADVVGMNKCGVLVGLGTDAMTTNMLEELRVAVWAQHLRARDASVGFGETTNALFLNNPEIASRAFGFPVGELRPGAAGDVVVVNYMPCTPMTSANLIGHVVFGISQGTVDATIVGGKVLMQNQKLMLDIDEERVNARARELAKDLWKRL